MIETMSIITATVAVVTYFVGYWVGHIHGKADMVADLIEKPSALNKLVRISERVKCEREQK